MRKAAAADVQWMGAQRDVLAGDLRGHVALDDLATLPHLYAVGPLEGVRGEVTIIDGHAWIARVLDGVIRVEESFNHRACFLVWAQVEAWATVPLVAVEGEAALEALVLAAARSRGLDHGGKPLVFLVEGVGSACLHVLDKRDAVRHDAEQHERAKVRVTVEDAAMQIVGFHSTHHRGVFTPMDSDLHMHMRTVDGRLAGHVETLRLRAGGLLRLPRVAR